MTSLLKRAEQPVVVAPEPPSLAVRPVSRVSANLMPTEVLDKRRLAWLKRRLLFVLIALVALIVLAYGLSMQQTGSAKDDLAGEQSQETTLNKQIIGFNDIVQLQSQTAEVRGQLATLMVGDLQWSQLIAKLKLIAPNGLTVDQFSGTSGEQAGGAAGSTPALGVGGADVIGTLTLSGTAKDYRSVAKYVDALGKTKGLTNPTPGSVTAVDGKSTFTITVSLTKNALGGRFTPPAATNGGK